VAQIKVSSYDKVEIGGRLFNGAPFSSALQLTPLAAGEDNTDRKVQSLKVTIGKVSTTLPAEATAILRNPNLPTGLYLLQRKDEVLLVVDGGDGGETYTCAFVFRDGRLLRRELFKPHTQDLDKAVPVKVDSY
jgi:hypothetical protein